MNHHHTDPVLRSGKALLEGFSRKALADYLTPLALTTPTMINIEQLIAGGDRLEVFAADPAGTDDDEFLSSCLADGPKRTVALGRGRTVESFVEGEEERLVFFKRPGAADVGTLQGEAWVSETAPPLQAMLRRDAQYRYHLDNRQVHLVVATWEWVEFVVTQPGTTQASRIMLRSCAVWPFVFGNEGFRQGAWRAQISARHAAALLGLSLLTVSRRIGEQKLPAVRPRSMSPGIQLAGLQEFLAYRQQFPQGHPNLRRIEAWQQQWRLTYGVELDAWLASESAGRSCAPVQEGRSEVE